jgi:ubiquinone/menaquinone biosynthesis C-methylase UbiE
MKLEQLRENWERWAEVDPMWAVCTDADKRNNQWRAEEFFASGRAEIDLLMAEVAQLGREPPRGAALDFGCGMGRLTQALARHFDQCTGVDISARMIELARQHNTCGERCRYLLNQADQLGQFAGETFDFIYCSRVLQHMAPAYSLAYVREFVRVLRPAGLLVFQLPSGQRGYKKLLKTLLPARAVNLLRRLVYDSTAVMEMYTVPEAAVGEAVAAAGARVLHLRYNQAAGADYTSPEYFVAKGGQAG